MKKSHKVLLIEDDLVAAEAMTDLLAGFGLDTVHAESADEAEPLIDAGDFCLVILDMQMKRTRTSAQALIGVGQGLLERIRSLYPGQSARRKYLLQILVMSAHDEHRFVVETMQMDADEFLSKNLDPHGRELQQAIRKALRHSGREEHSDCAAIMAKARKTGAPAPTGEKSRRVRLSISGVERERQRTEITIDGHKVMVSATPLRVLLLFVTTRLDSGESWIVGKEHGANEEGWKSEQRLRKDIEEQAGIDGRSIIQLNAGSFRLHPDVELEDVDWSRLAKHSDPNIRKFALNR